MSTIYRRRKGETHCDGKDTPVLSRDVFGPEVETCFACGEPEASGLWQGVAGRVSVCSRCAASILPKLAADAVAGEFADNPNIIPQLYQAVGRMKAAFWQAAAVAISRATKLHHRETARAAAGERSAAGGNGL